MHWSLSIPLKTSENVLFSDVFRRYWKKSVTWNGLIWRHFSPCGTHCISKKKNKYNCIGLPAFKSQTAGYQFNQKPLHHYQHSENPHQHSKDTADFIKSHKLKGHDHFDHAHTNIIETPFSFSQFIPACKKSVYFICSFLK